MERISNNIPSGITADIDASPKISQSNSNDGYFSTNGNTNYTRIGMIVVILLFLGVNIFSYLGDFLQIIKEALAPLLKTILESLGYVVTETTKDVTQIAASGAKLGIDVAAGTVESGINVIQGQLDLEQGANQGQGQRGQSPSQPNNMPKQNLLSASLSSALADAEYNSEPMPDDSMSSTQRLGPGKSGYCYIGEDRGFRSCIAVRDGDVCMSGDIFPSQALCVNPSLRE
jgi:hypothetical protein